MLYMLNPPSTGSFESAHKRKVLNVNNAFLRHLARTYRSVGVLQDWLVEYQCCYRSIHQAGEADV